MANEINKPKTLRYIIIAAIAGLIGYIFTWGIDYCDRQDKREIEQTNLVIHRLTDEMKQRENKSNKINSAISDLRRTLYNIRLACHYNKPLTLYEQAKLRADMRSKVIKSEYGARYKFDDKIVRLIRRLIDFDSKIENVCAPDAPKGAEWHKHQTEISQYMHAFIQQDEIKIQELESKKLDKKGTKPLCFIPFL